MLLVNDRCTGTKPGRYSFLGCRQLYPPAVDDTGVTAWENSEVQYSKRDKGGTESTMYSQARYHRLNGQLVDQWLLD